MPAEVEIKAGFTVTQQIGIAIAILMEQNKEYMLDWVKDALRSEASKRKEIVLQTDGPLAAEQPLEDEDMIDGEALRERAMPQQPSEAAIAKFEPCRAFQFCSTRDFCMP